MPSSARSRAVSAFFALFTLMTHLSGSRGQTPPAAGPSIEISDFLALAPAASSQDIAAAGSSGALLGAHYNDISLANGDKLPVIAYAAGPTTQSLGALPSDLQASISDQADAIWELISLSPEAGPSTLSGPGNLTPLPVFNVTNALTGETSLSENAAAAQAFFGTIFLSPTAKDSSGRVINEILPGASSGQAAAAPSSQGGRKLQQGLPTTVCNSASIVQAAVAGYAQQSASTFTASLERTLGLGVIGIAASALPGIGDVANLGIGTVASLLWPDPSLSPDAVLQQTYAALAQLAKTLVEDINACQLRDALGDVRKAANDWNGTHYSDQMDKKSAFENLKTVMNGHLSMFLNSNENAPEKTISYLIGFGTLYVAVQGEQLSNHAYYYGNISDADFQVQRDQTAQNIEALLEAVAAARTNILAWRQKQIRCSSVNWPFKDSCNIINSPNCTGQSFGHSIASSFGFGSSCDIGCSWGVSDDLNPSYGYKQNLCFPYPSYDQQQRGGEACFNDISNSYTADAILAQQCRYYTFQAMSSFAAQLDSLILKPAHLWKYYTAPLDATSTIPRLAGTSSPTVSMRNVWFAPQGGPGIYISADLNTTAGVTPYGNDWGNFGAVPGAGVLGAIDGTTYEVCNDDAFPAGDFQLFSGSYLFGPPLFAPADFYSYYCKSYSGPIGVQVPEHTGVLNTVGHAPAHPYVFQQPQLQHGIWGNVWRNIYVNADGTPNTTGVFSSYGEVPSGLVGITSQGEGSLMPAAVKANKFLFTVLRRDERIIALTVYTRAQSVVSAVTFQSTNQTVSFGAPLAGDVSATFGPPSWYNDLTPQEQEVAQWRLSGIHGQVSGTGILSLGATFQFNILT
ncbi:hypothetical protein WJX73_002263 [Symbiochloris irregularis]|uniref:Uncharacterized protein n=1 Tax=Symbiochloris irregularis TaxID=706552 RepID=A0AAW1PQS1_9CHLO